MSSLAELLQTGVDRELLIQLQSLPPTDAGNAGAYDMTHGHESRFNHSRGKWFCWNGQVWLEDQTAEVERAALHAVRLRQLAALQIPDTDLRKEHVDWAIRSESTYSIKAMLRSAQSIRRLATIAADYDRDPFLFTLKNGTLDLRNGTLRPFDPNDLITKASNVLFDPGATCPRWMRFLNEVFAGDQLTIRFVQRAVGYSLTGDTREQCLFILHGAGSNGKSVLLEILVELLGAHAQVTSLSSLLLQDPGPRNDIAKLHGARLVKASEAQANAVLDEATVKEITGGDTISARFLFHEFFEFRPQFKIWIATNHLFVIRDTQYAMWRRIRLLEFSQEFSGKNRDANLKDKLQAELSGILNWAIEGCLEWRRSELGNAPKIERATETYRQRSDAIGRFLAARCTNQPRDQVTGKELFDAYLDWCGEAGESPESNNIFANAMTERGIRKKRTNKGVVYVGVGLRPRPKAVDSQGRAI
jgi:putative DNA primase/helicase